MAMIACFSYAIRRVVFAGSHVISSQSLNIEMYFSWTAQPLVLHFDSLYNEVEVGIVSVH